MLRRPFARLLLVVIPAFALLMGAPALTASAAPQPAGSVAPHTNPADSLITLTLRDGCGGANGKIHISGNNSVDVYGVLWENPSGCAGKTQQLWFSRTFTPGTTPVNTMIQPTAGPGVSTGFHSITTIPGVTSGSVTLCSTGPSPFHCWDTQKF
jgi:hypothetical protein